MKKCCACCGEFSLESNLDGAICLFCGWVKDRQQEENIHLKNGRNKLSLAEARYIYFSHRKDRSVF
ncbi:MAG: CPCC family cysteine-rich protein [Bacilli bacterium]|jgi:molybdopterin synthase catalytic subunit|nr:CPCC family cysteine-rich protein [Bacilli bacterium]NLN80476.1 hypothetical protein [Erysipelotrichia bacterium]